MPREHLFRTQLKDAAEEIGAEEQRERGRRGHFRSSARLQTAVLTLCAVLVVSVAAPAVRDFVADDGQRDAGPGAPKSDQPVPFDLSPSLALAKDPIEKRYPWGVRTYASPTGRCILTGRLLGGKLGRLQDGKFAAFGRNMSGFCGDLRRNHIVFTIRDYYKLSGGRTVLYGVADRRVSSLDLLTVGDAERTALRIADDDSFVAVRLGARAFRGQRLRIGFIDGMVKTVPLQPALPTRRADPRLP